MDEKRPKSEFDKTVTIEPPVVNLEMDHVEVITPNDTLCGIGRFKPSCMQPLARMYVYAPTLSFALVASYAYGFYLMSQVTTLEKQFGISSTESGLMTASNDIGFMATILIWSHFAKGMHKPRVLGLTTLIFGISGLIPIIPHLLMVSQASEMYDRSGDDSTGTLDRKSLCLARNASEEEKTGELSGDALRIRDIAYGIMFLSFILQGVSRSPRNPLTQTYMDDNVPKTQTGLYLGIIAGLSTLGPVLGSIIGGLFSNIYVTLEDTDLQPRDPRFIGAWWLGFVVFSSVAFIAAGPLSLFPRWMPHSPKAKAQLQQREQKVKDQEMSNGLAIDQDGSSAVKKSLFKRFIATVIDMFPSLLRLITNPLFMTLVACDSFMSLTVSGRVTFYPKYMQQYFRFPTDQSNFFFGITVVLPYACGMLVGGLLTNRLKLTIRGCLGFRWLTDGLSAGVAFLALLVVCVQPTIYGLSNPSNDMKLVAADVGNMTCGTECMCTEQDFLPSCGPDNRTYFSPCHAGCLSVLPNRDFGNCSCIPEFPSDKQTLTPGYCEGQCDTIVYYFILSVLGSICSSLNSVPSNLVLLRSVHDRDRSLMVGFTGFLRSIIGYFAGPIIFGRVVDTACILWSEPNNEGSCSIYDGDDLRIKIHVFAGGVLLGIIFLNGFAVLMTYKMKRYRKIVKWERKGFEDAAKKKRDNKDKTNDDDDDMPPGYNDNYGYVPEQNENTEF